MAEAVGCLADVLEDEGPFDGVFGFSQGAALTLSYLYQQQIKGVRPLIDWVMLFSSAMPCGADVNIGEKVVARLQELDVDVRDRTMAQKALAGVESEFVRALQRTVVDADDSNSLMPWFDMAVYQGEQSEAAPRVMIPDILKQKIKTPTVHVWGRNDHPFMINMAMVAESICDKSRSKSVMHTGSHQPPQKTMEVRASLRAMEWAIVQAQATV
jgi:pimeloyl-ACP methyl ester carboxylesterase